MTKERDIRWKMVCRTVGLWLALSGLIGCGYHFKGAGLKAPEGVETIAVPVLANKTSEIGIETVLTNDLAYEFTRSKVLRVVAKDGADAVLSGSIVSVAVGTISHTKTYASNEQRVTVTLSMELTRSDGRVLWADGALRDSEVFRVSSNRLATDRNKKTAIGVISERLAEKTHNRILQGF
jgi:outer membrane lipopolysaccharide assembly protein LptE/RlpB